MNEIKTKEVSSDTIFDTKYIRFLIILAIILIILFKVIFLVSYVASDSMAPTYNKDDLVIYNRLAYHFQEPKLGDCIVFEADGIVYAKRVIGVSGDEIEIQYGTVKINGQEIDESAYLPEGTLTATGNSFYYTVPEGCVFVMGDWREQSLDSRRWSEPYIDEECILGKEILCIPTHKIKSWFGEKTEYQQYMEYQEELLNNINN